MFKYLDGHFQRRHLSLRTIFKIVQQHVFKNYACLYNLRNKHFRESSSSDSESGFEDGSAQISIRNLQSIHQSDVNEMLKEWSIPFDDLQFKERLRHGRHGDIFRGQWHGDVLIYTFNDYKENEMNLFLEEIAQLSLIRHESIMLFMGACLAVPNLAVVTSKCKGHSLYEHMHIIKDGVPENMKMNIARELAQAMGYLHAKGVVHKGLNSRNVSIENSRVKIYLMDQGMARKDCDRNDYGCLPRGHLSYLSPELMRSLQIVAPYVFSQREFTQESDIYAFGSLLFELLFEKFAFNEMESESVIWLIGNGHHDKNVNNKLKCNNTLKELIVHCWSMDSGKRPRFSLIVKRLVSNIPLHMLHCSSEPDGINRTGCANYTSTLIS